MAGLKSWDYLRQALSCDNAYRIERYGRRSDIVCNVTGRPGELGGIDFRITRRDHGRLVTARGIDIIEQYRKSDFRAVESIFVVLGIFAARGDFAEHGARFQILARDQCYSLAGSPAIGFGYDIVSCLQRFSQCGHG